MSFATAVLLRAEPVRTRRSSIGASAPARAADADARSVHRARRTKTKRVTATKSAVTPPSGRRSAATHARTTSSPRRFHVRASGEASAHSLARRAPRAIAHANGTTSIPLAAHQTSPPNDRVIAAAPTAAACPASRPVRSAASLARAPSATNEMIHATQTMSSPRTPSPQKGASTAGHKKLVAPLVIGSLAWKRIGCPSAIARAY